MKKILFACLLAQIPYRAGQLRRLAQGKAEWRCPWGVPLI